MTSETVSVDVLAGDGAVAPVERTADGPVGLALLTYGQSGDPASVFFEDKTQLFATKQWGPILFTDDAIAADPELRQYEISE